MSRRAGLRCAACCSSLSYLRLVGCCASFTLTSRALSFLLLPRALCTSSYTRNIGTRSYRAPELKSGRYNSSIDLFAAGCTFFALMLAEQPSDRVDVGFPDRFQHISPHRLLATFPFESPQLHFLAMLTQADPACRLTAEQALAHPFITGVMPAAAGAPAAAAPAPVGGAGASGI